MSLAADGHRALELLDECLRLERELFEADRALEFARHEFEVAVEWALDAGADPRDVLGRLSADMHRVLGGVALEFGFDLRVTEPEQ